jgi:glyoxylase I family protein
MAVPLLAVVHVNVNCSDLERSLHFYRDVLGLAPMSHTHPEPQDGRGFGLEGRVQWDAHLLHDARGLEGPAIDLLEWKQPLPAGRPYAAANHLGLIRLCLGHPDLDALHRRLLAEGVPCLSAPQEIPLDAEQERSARLFCCLDPDGTTLQFLERRGEPRLLHLYANCSDLQRSSDWYRRVLGLACVGRSSPGPVAALGFGLKGLAEWRAERLAIPGRGEHFAIDLLEWRTPPPIGRPYRTANHLGLFRMAFLVEDLRTCRAELGRLGVACGEPVELDMGPELPIDGLWALFLRDPDGSCLELIQRPRVRT